jgi:hypothetical protein
VINTEEKIPVRNVLSHVHKVTMCDDDVFKEVPLKKLQQLRNLSLDHDGCTADSMAWTARSLHQAVYGH